MKKCISCPELLTEDYGVGSDTCANCLAEENDVALKVARILRDTVGDINQYDRAKKILSSLDKIEKDKTVTRFEVIDHRKHSSNLTRVFVAFDISIELSYQDSFRTLKVFVHDR